MTADSTAMSLNPESLNLFPIVAKKNYNSSKMHPSPQFLYAFFLYLSIIYQLLSHVVPGQIHKLLLCQAFSLSSLPGLEFH